MKNILVVFFALMGCGNQTPDNKMAITKPTTVITNKLQSDSAYNPYNSRPFVDFDTARLSNSDSLKSYLLKTFSNDLIDITTKDIKEIGIPFSIQLQDLGTVRITPINFSEDLPEVAFKKAYLVISDSIKKAALLYLDDLTPIKIRERDKNFYLAGYYQVRAKGFFLVYGIKNINGKIELKKIFDSFEVEGCEIGVPVINSSLDCISYEPFTLKLANNDTNNDGLLDLVFSGTLNTYCKGLEMGWGRKDRKPLKSEKLNIVFQTYNAPDTLYWKLADTIICKKLYYESK